jgi:hypothetical protein
LFFKGLTTPSPVVGSMSTRKRNVSATIPCEAGRPKVSRTLDFNAVEKCEKAVWITTDHDYVLNAKGIRNADELDHTNPMDKIQQLDENAALKLKLLRLENVKDDDAKFQFWTNLPNYSVFLAVNGRDSTISCLQFVMSYFILYNNKSLYFNTTFRYCTSRNYSFLPSLYQLFFSYALSSMCSSQSTYR